MAKSTPRLFVDQPLGAGLEVALAAEQAHYLGTVLRLVPGDAVAVFNGRDGEFLAYVAEAAKKKMLLRLERLTSAAAPPPDIDYLFAPLKHTRLDYLVQKATELGARRLRPVITARTIAERVNLERMRANVIEAAEQCNLVFLPEVLEPVSLNAALRGWESGRALIYCDEAAEPGNAVAALSKLKTPAAILVGPEGGFTVEERAMLKALPFVTAISLGPRIMRADTAAVAILALVQAVLGDWGTRA
ncbi:MAG: 16S rRNA (uracil(1498)-N(3))-methyltransferase [Alphaproteobacteria bacterium]|nr:16S rRNA (uracil(1498)-N(3))-methyltransferase [Alphaproteobacteria bacterium]